MTQVTFDLYSGQVTYFKQAIGDMAERTLRCVAIAYVTQDLASVPAGEEELSKWALPEDNLVLLAIVGIKVFITSIQYICLLVVVLFTCNSFVLCWICLGTGLAFCASSSPLFCFVLFFFSCNIKSLHY